MRKISLVLILFNFSLLYSQIPTNGLILALDASDSASYPGSGNTWYDLSGQNAHAEALNLPSFGLNGDIIKNFDFDGINDEFHSVDISQEYRDLIVITKLETNSGLPMLFAHYDNQDDSMRFDTGKLRNTGDGNDWQQGEGAAVFINGQFSQAGVSVFNTWSFIRTYRSNTSGFGTSFRYELSSSFSSRRYSGKVNLILAYNRKLSNQEVTDIYNTLSGRLSGNASPLFSNPTPEMSQTQIALNNSTVSVTFSELAYGGSSNSTSTLEVADFSLSLSGGSASLSSATPSSINVSGTTIGLGISLSGTPNGSEVLTILPASNSSVFGASGSTVSTTQTSNTTKLIPNIERDGLILYVDSRNQSSYPGDGTTLYDISGNNNDFTINGSMNYNTTDGFTFVSGQTSKYFQQTNFPHPANTFTNEIFIKTSQTSNGGIMSYNKTNNDNANLIWISGDNSGNIRTHTNGTIKNINANISNNEWRHFVQTVDKSSGVEKIYVDGVLIQTFTSNNSSIPTNGCLALGQDYDTTCGGFNTNDAFGGFFPVFRLYNKVLTQSEISQNYNTLIVSPPKIKRTQITIDNSTVSVTFDELVFNTNSASGTLEVSDFSLSLSNGVASLSSATPSSITISGTTIGLGISLSGTPNGSEVLTILPASNSSVFGASGSTVSTTQTSNTTKLIPNIVTNGLILYLDADNPSSYPGAGSNWYDLSGNNYDFTIDPSAFRTSNGIKHMDFEGSYGQTIRIVSGSRTDVPANANATMQVFSSIKNSTGNLRTLTRGASADHQVIINNGANDLGMYDNGGGGFIDSGFDITSLPNPYTQFNFLDFKLSTSSPYYSFKFNNNTTNYQITNSNATFNNGFASIGNSHGNGINVSSNGGQPWGKIGVFLYYNRKLTDSETLQNYNAFRSRYSLPGPPPTDISLSSNTIYENSSIGSNIGTLSAVDSDTSVSSLTYTFTSSGDARDDDNGSFTISGTSLLTSTTLDFETKTSYNIYVNVSDGTSNFAKAFTVNVNDINENDSDGDGVTDPLDQCANTPNGESVDANGCADSQKDPDNDGISGVSDNCPTTANADQADGDSDGVGDLCDNCTDISNTNQSDNDGDAIGDVCDTDDDNDGVLDTEDAFPKNPLETLDTDGDGVGNNQDLDADNDGLLDTSDNCPAVVNVDQLDTDGDGQGDACDIDDDNDGYSDGNEYGCDSNMLLADSTPPDMDNDFICDLYDDDIDGDNVLNYNDAFPEDSKEWADTDSDGIGDNADSDDDNDGFSDADESQCGSDPLSANSLPIDSDGDSTPDCIDQDDDNDSYPDIQDLFPLDPNEWADTDGDATGDNADTDDDNDGYSDQDEISCQSDPLDANNVPLDFDNDLSPDCVDQDDDNDQCLDSDDDFPLNRLLCKDCDNDGIDNRYEFDSDNDGIGDYQDDFPCDPQEWTDSDKDGIGDNKDQDDNNDGFPDEDLIVSTVLTPSENGLESTWKIINLDKYLFTKVKVYSPDGSLVYESMNYQNDWRGDNITTGNQLPSGPYYYKIVLGGTNAEIRQGWLYIFN